MSRQFETVTSITFSHDYYTDGTSADFTLAPTSETKKLIKRFRLLFGQKSKYSSDVYVLLQDTNDGTPIIALPSEYQLRFAISLENPDLINFTDLPGLDPGEIYYFENQSVGNDLHGASFEKMELVGSRFAWTDLTAGTTTVRARSAATSDEVEFDTYTEDSVLQVRIDLEGMQPGIYELYRNALGTPDRTVYFDPELLGKGHFGILHLTENSALNISAAHQIVMEASEKRWRYFVVLKGNHGTYDYSVSDDGGGGLTFQDPTVAPTYTMTDADNATVTLLGNLYSGSTVEVFVSTTAIPYQEAARSLITLGRKLPADLTPTPLISSLPNPPSGEAQAAVIVGVDPPTLSP